MELYVLGLLAVAVVVGAYVMVTYNRFVMQRNRVEEAFSTMDVYLLKRYDLIPNLVETVKGYATHEKETFERVIQARNRAVSATNVDDKVEAENAFSAVLGRLFALAEAYPDLKANTNFIDLQNQLKAVEEVIANARKFFNAVTRQFNTMIEVFPANFVAQAFKFTKKPLFEVEEATQRQNVKVQF